MSGLGAITDNIERTITLSDRTKSLDSTLIHDNNDITKLTNGEACLTSETTNFRVGELLLPNGESYSGSLLGNIPEGSGKYRWSDGCRYEGEWRHGITHGHGKLEFPSGAVYDGEFSGGYMHGEGTYIGPDKVTYRGRWRFNLKHGLGYQMYPNGDILEGSWIQGTPEGPGKYTWANGNVYFGNMKGGKISGKGTLTWINGDSYEGSWLNDAMHGVGMYSWSDGSCYIGTWTHSLKDGKGTFYPSGSRLTAGQELYLNALRKRGLLPDMRKQNQVSHIHHAASVDMGNVTVSGKLPERNLLNFGQSRPTNVSLERRWSLEVAIEKVIGHDLDGDMEDAMSAPILEREYMQGILISEVVLNERFSPPSSRARRRQKRFVRELKRPGEAIIKGHRSYDLMLSLQLGIRYTVGKITPIQRREIRTSDFGPRASFWMYFPKGGSQLTPTHQSEDFKWKDYCPMVFRNLREMFKIDAADYMMSICGNDALRELSSPGKSGSVFFLSQDDRFMIKTLRKSEVKVCNLDLNLSPSQITFNQNFFICLAGKTENEKSQLSWKEVLFLVLRLLYYFVVVTVQNVFLGAHFFFLWTALDCFSSSQGSIGNNLSTSEVEVRSAYTLPSPNPTLWNYTGYVVVKQQHLAAKDLLHKFCMYKREKPIGLFKVLSLAQYYLSHYFA